ncbi:MAG: hypothetical protein JO339_12625 [Alphaproteobacteria bacterium]|nr:hypothetical protein [Alphaproteobacteria bacterium]
MPTGTGFIIWVPYADHGFRFVVTAQHVIDDLIGKKASFRLNRRSGGCESVRFQPEAHCGFHDKSVDVAIIPLNVGPDVYEFWDLHMERQAWIQRMATLQAPGPGDEVSTVGLYTTHPGLTKNRPVVRTGHIAAMPAEPVRTKFGSQVAYLVELHSILGLSGSPVFLNVFPTRMKDGTIEHLTGPMQIIIGVQVGYHLIESKEDQIIVLAQHDVDPLNDKETPADVYGSDELRTGFSVVVPAQRIFQIIESSVVQQNMKEGIERVQKRGGFRPSSVPPGAAKSAHPPIEGDEQTRLLESPTDAIKHPERAPFGMSVDTSTT